MRVLLALLSVLLAVMSGIGLVFWASSTMKLLEDLGG
jgi:hypothetical protein